MNILKKWQRMCHAMSNEAHPGKTYSCVHTERWYWESIHFCFYTECEKSHRHHRRGTAEKVLVPGGGLSHGGKGR